PVPTDFEAVSLGTNISLSWEAIDSSRDFIDYNIYKNSELLDSTTQLFYFDQNVPTGTYSYYVTASYSGGWESEPSTIVEIEHTDVNGIQIPLANLLKGNYPNPFNPETTVYFSVEATSSLVNIEVYNLKGQKIKTLVSEQLSSGSHSAVWNGKDDLGKSVASAVYLYKMRTGNYTSTKKMILMK
ncbi:MAG: T9SS type A sorting domain-containing protein, partial [Candidatus Cloacimonetes bacterium]|nr:T9SS type A sorting domain-containing protein [Candidatus Cloacimonadota bacterium]